MYKLAKWIYQLGVRHERRRIKLLIAQHRNDKPERPYDTEKKSDSDWENERYEKSLAVWYEVGAELKKLIEPNIVDYEQAPVYKSPIEGED